MEDPTTSALEARVAKLAGKEAGMFCSSGTLSNQLGLRTWLLQPPHSVLFVPRSRRVFFAHRNATTPSADFHLSQFLLYFLSCDFRAHVHKYEAGGQFEPLPPLFSFLPPPSFSPLLPPSPSNLEADVLLHIFRYLFPLPGLYNQFVSLPHLCDASFELALPSLSRIFPQRTQS